MSEICAGILAHEGQNMNDEKVKTVSHAHFLLIFTGCLGTGLSSNTH